MAELKNRSFRVKEKSVARLKEQSEKLVVPMYIVMAAAIDAFDPVKDKEDRDFLRAFHKNFDADDIIASVEHMTDEQKKALLKKLTAK